MNLKFKKIICLFLILSLTAALISCSKAEAETPSGMKLISNDIVDYNLYVPNAWVTDTSTGFICAYYSEVDRSNISMEAFEIEDSKISLDDFWSSYEKDFNLTFQDLEYITRETTLIDGIAANKYVYTATITGFDYQFMQVVAIRAGTVYIFTYTASPTKFDSHIDEVLYILEKITFNG